MSETDHDHHCIAIRKFGPSRDEAVSSKYDEICKVIKCMNTVLLALFSYCRNLTACFCLFLFVSVSVIEKSIMLIFMKYFFWCAFNMWYTIHLETVAIGFGEYRKRLEKE